MPRTPDPTAALVASLAERHLTIAVAESLTGGQLVAELVRIPGASAVVAGGVVAYQTALKHSLLHVDAGLLAEHGAVHRDVARQMAIGVRAALAVDGRPADIGLATTGVAGPKPQDGQSVGTVYLGVSFGEQAWAIHLRLSGDRAEIRASTVEHAIEAVRQLIDHGKPSFAE
jgi:nicotinamide-nucleotide amidase